MTYRSRAGLPGGQRKLGPSGSHSEPLRCNGRAKTRDLLSFSSNEDQEQQMKAHPGWPCSKHSWALLATSAIYGTRHGGRRVQCRTSGDPPHTLRPAAARGDRLAKQAAPDSQSGSRNKEDDGAGGRQFARNHLMLSKCEG